MGNCVGAFKSVNKEIKYFPNRRFNEDNLDYLCNKYWIGYTKGYTPWEPSKDMFPPPERTGYFGDICQTRDETSQSWWEGGGSYLFPGDDEKGNQWVQDCGKYIDLVAEVNNVKPDEEVTPEEER